MDTARARIPDLDNTAFEIQLESLDKEVERYVGTRNGPGTNMVQCGTNHAHGHSGARELCRIARKGSFVWGGVCVCRVDNFGCRAGAINARALSMQAHMARGGKEHRPRWLISQHTLTFVAARRCVVSSREF